MSLKHTSSTLILLLGGLTVVAIWFAFEGSHSRSSGHPPVVSVLPPPTPTVPPPAEPIATVAPEDRPADREGVQKAVDSFVTAFRKGDGKAVADHWTAEGEYIGDDGATFRGRADLEKAYAEFFKKNPGNSLEVEVEAIRFPSKDTAVVEGHFKLRKAKGELIVSKCSFLYAREEGKWLIAIAREWPGDGLSLRDLEWLIGSWESKRDGVVVSTKYEWTANKSFIKSQFTITQDGQKHTGTQMIGKDPSTGLLRVWTFEDSGGIGEADIVRDGKKFVHAARGVTPDGQVLTATNIMTQVDADSFLWHAIDRWMDDESLPDLPPIKVTRVKP
ncbi:MAG: SgcJ/EcaC family oxidoreductase [Planctomycetia bacterium]|nr:SgcJ/EcaC family oxidoreductase [Planctomycetia bacterium]